jgi:hypothetical protein
MTAAAVVTIIAVAIAVLVLASYLIGVVFVLRRVSSRLDAVATGLATIADKTAPIGPVVGQINRDLTTVQGRLHTVLTRERAPKAPPPPRPRTPTTPAQHREREQPELPAPWVVAPRARVEGVPTKPADR